VGGRKNKTKGSEAHEIKRFEKNTWFMQRTRLDRSASLQVVRHVIKSNMAVPILPFKIMGEKIWQIVPSTELPSFIIFHSAIFFRNWQSHAPTHTLK
jgi:hypothetical protein